MLPTFTPLYDWIACRTELTTLEKCLICRVLRFGEAGCFESNTRLAKVFGVHRSTIIETIRNCIKKEWIAICYMKKQQRVLYVTDDKKGLGPLFEEKSGRKTRPLVKKVVGKHDQLSKNPAPPVGKSDTMIHLSYKDDTNIIDKEISISQPMKQTAGPMSKVEFEKRRREQIAKLLKQTPQGV